MQHRLNINRFLNSLTFIELFNLTFFLKLLHYRRLQIQCLIFIVLLEFRSLSLPCGFLLADLRLDERQEILLCLAYDSVGESVATLSV